MASHSEHGLTVVPGQGMTRIKMECQHQHGLMYVVPAEKSWVCSQELMLGHALSGFLGELTAQKDERVEKLMRRWGIYFRPLPLEAVEEAPS